MNKTTFSIALIATVSSLLFISVPLFASEMDARIEASAKQSYVFKTYLKDDNVSIQSKEGVVTLTGTVSEDSHKSLAGETVASLPGVKSVDNEVKIQGEVPDKLTDAWLITKVKSTLMFHRNVSALDTKIFVKNGVVTLRGQATSIAQKDLATEYVKDVEGVRNVINEMTVLPAEMKPARTAMDGKMDVISEKMSALGETIDDASTTALVKTTLLYHRSTSALSTTVETKDGVVRLGGEAANGTEKDLTTKLVSDVHGVKAVINNMTVKGAETKTH